MEERKHCNKTLLTEDITEFIKCGPLSELTKFMDNVVPEKVGTALLEMKNW